jgi:hypothetical protein
MGGYIQNPQGLLERSYFLEAVLGALGGQSLGHKKPLGPSNPFARKEKGEKEEGGETTAVHYPDFSLARFALNNEQVKNTAIYTPLKQQAPRLPI